MAGEVCGCRFGGMCTPYAEQAALGECSPEPCAEARDGVVLGKFEGRNDPALREVVDRSGATVHS